MSPINNNQQANERGILADLIKRIRQLETRHWISEITSVDGSITVANPDGPVVDLSGFKVDPYTTFTPTLTASGADPTGWTCLSMFFRIGELAHFFGYAKAGVGATMGTGTWSIECPLTNSSLTDLVGGTAQYLTSTPPVKEWMLTPRIVSGVEFSYPATWPGGNSIDFGDATGIVPAANDILRFNVVFRGLV